MMDFPRARMDFIWSGFISPWTTEMLIPAFSNVSPTLYCQNDESFEADLSTNLDNRLGNLCNYVALIVNLFYFRTPKFKIIENCIILINELNLFRIDKQIGHLNRKFILIGKLFY